MPAAPRRATSRRTVLRAGAAVTALATAGCTREDGDLLGAPAGCDAQSTTPARPRRGRRNLIVVSVDDLSWQELGCYGSTFNETPEIDRLAAEGTRFTQAYAAAPNCSPSRAALMTGLYPGRTGITDYLRPEAAPSDAFLSPDLATVPTVLASRGYTCGLIGKWHLTETYSGPYDERPGNPFAHGFTDVRVSEQRYIGSGDYVHPYAFAPDLPARRPGEYLTDRLADEVEDFLDEHRAEPFFLHVSNYAVHSRLAATPDLVAKYEEKGGGDATEDQVLMAAMLESVDQQVGRIRLALECQVLAQDTVVILTSDNGGGPRPGNLLRGGKGGLYENGIRVPLVVWGPGTVRAGEESDLVTSGIDLLPTAAALAGAAVPVGGAAVDGISIVPTLTGEGDQAARDAVFWAYPHFIGRNRPHAAVRVGDDKLVMYLRTGETEFYDLAADPGETRDRARRDPATAARLRGRLEAHLADLDLYPGPPPRRLRGDGVRERFDGDLGAYTLAVVPAAAAVPPATVVGGRLRIGGDTSRLLALAGSGPTSAECAIVLDPGPLPGRQQERTLLAGLAADADTHLLVRYRHDLRQVGWVLGVDGQPQDTEDQPLDRLDGTVDLASDDARLALCLRGSTGAAYVDQGDGWEFLFRFDAGPAFDLGRPDVRSRLRWAVGGAAADGAEVSIDGFTAQAL